MTQSSLNPQKKALARRHAYTVLSRIFQDGLVPALLPFAEQISQLAPLIPDPYDPDEAAAAHHRIFSLTVFPYESFFLDESGLLGGPAATRVLAAYETAGFQPGDGGAAPDQIGHELALLAFLAGAEAKGWEGGEESEARRMAQWQHQFLSQHLLRWLPPLVIALRRVGDPFYVAVANLTLDFSVAHLKAYGLAGVGPGAFLPEPPSLLEEEKTGLRDIADYLTTPAYSGIFISREDVGRLARQQQIPRGFGKRGQLLVNALRAAVQYEAMPAFLTELEKLATQWQSAYRILTRTHPALRLFLAPWQDQTAVTQILLEQVHLTSAGLEEEE